MKHIVLFKLNENSSECQDRVAGILSKMNPQNVPMIEALSVHKDFLRSDRSYDLMLEVTLPEEELSNYANFPFHCEVKKEFAPFVEKTITIDYR